MSCYNDAKAKRRQMECRDGKWILSYGGGVNSSALFFYILDKKLPLDLIIFADTGEESTTTQESVHNLSVRCFILDIPFITVKSELGRLRDYYAKKKKVPSFMKRDCTSKFKIAPIRKYLRETYGKKQKFNMYIGIASDEASRRSQPDVNYVAYHYPFVDAGITRNGNMEILRKHNFKATKSGCVGCIYNKKAEWIALYQNKPKEFERWLNLDKNNTKYPKVTLSPNFKLEDIKKAFENQKSLSSFVDAPEPQCDVNGGCFL